MKPGWFTVVIVCAAYESCSYHLTIVVKIIHGQTDFREEPSQIGTGTLPLRKIWDYFIKIEHVLLAL